MKRTYVYKGFDATVDLEPIWETSGNVTLRPPSGYVAVVQIRRVGSIRLTVAPIRLSGDNQRPFATQGDALMAGYSAGQRIIDDTLSL